MPDVGRGPEEQRDRQAHERGQQPRNDDPAPLGLGCELPVVADEFLLVNRLSRADPDEARTKLFHPSEKGTDRRVRAEVDGIPPRVEEDEFRDWPDVGIAVQALTAAGIVQIRLS